MKSEESPTPETEVKIETPPADSSKIKLEEDDGSLNDDLLEIDLSAIEIASGVLEEMENSMKNTDNYENLMGACSSTAQALKQTISDVLRSRENIVFASGDTTNELEASLSQKIADFENVVNGCFVAKDAKTDLTNIKHPAFSNVIITEVDETSEEANVSSESSPAQISEDKPNPDITTENPPESKTDSKTLPKVNDTVSDKNSSEGSDKKESNKKENKDNKVSEVEVNVLKLFLFIS